MDPQDKSGSSVFNSSQNCLSSQNYNFWTIIFTKSWTETQMWIKEKSDDQPYRNISSGSEYYYKLLVSQVHVIVILEWILKNIITSKLTSHWLSLLLQLGHAPLTLTMKDTGGSGGVGTNLSTVFKGHVPLEPSQKIILGNSETHATKNVNIMIIVTCSS